MRLASLLLLLCLSLPAMAEEDRLAEPRVEFQRAWAAVGQGSANQDSDALKAYPLYPYLESARLSHELLLHADTPTVDAPIAAFLARHDREPVSRDLRRIWLTNLAERQQWARFAEEYRSDEASETLQCHALHAELALKHTEHLAEKVIEHWLSAHASPGSCEPLYDWLRKSRRLTPALIEDRAELALEVGDVSFARELARQLPATPGKTVLNEASWVEQPALGMDTFIARPERSVPQKLLLSIWSRLARKDAGAARQRYEALVSARRFDAAGASPYARALALGLAWDRLPEAREFFAKIAAADRDEAVAEWSARAALWASDWKDAASAIAAMPPELRQQPRWQYFSIRADEQLGHADTVARYQALAAQNGFYPALAAARTGHDYAPHPQPLLFEESRIGPLEKSAPFVRARELFLCGLRNEASREWQAAEEALDADSRVQTIALAYRWGWYDQEVATASRNNVYEDYSLLYPRPFAAEVAAASASSGVAADLLYAIMRQETLYRADAVSHAGAIGLLQLVPETARQDARRLQRPVPDREQLFDPSVNLRLGAEELRRMLASFDGQALLAIAAYNAGPNAVARWLPPQPHEADIWIENIPFNETRTYVQRVLWHRLVFSWLDTGRPQSTQSWLQPVLAAQRTAGGGR